MSDFQGFDSIHRAFLNQEVTSAELRIYIALAYHDCKTVEDVMETLCITTSTAYKGLAGLRSQGYIHFKKKKIEVLNCPVVPKPEPLPKPLPVPVPKSEPLPKPKPKAAPSLELELPDPRHRAMYEAVMGDPYLQQRFTGKRVIRHEFLVQKIPFWSNKYEHLSTDELLDMIHTCINWLKKETGRAERAKDFPRTLGNWFARTQGEFTTAAEKFRQSHEAEDEDDVSWSERADADGIELYE